MDDLAKRFLATAPEGVELVSIEVLDQRSSVVAMIRHEGREIMLAGWYRGPVHPDALGAAAEMLGKNYRTMLELEELKNGRR